MQKHVPCPVRRHGGMRPVHPEGVSHGSSGGVSLVTSADRLSARRGEGMPPRLPILASRAPRQPRRPPDGPRARGGCGVAAEASPPRAGSEGTFAAAGGAAGGARPPPPPPPPPPAAPRG